MYALHYQQLLTVRFPFKNCEISRQIEAQGNFLFLCISSKTFNGLNNTRCMASIYITATQVNRTKLVRSSPSQDCFESHHIVQLEIANASYHLDNFHQNQSTFYSNLEKLWCSMTATKLVPFPIMHDL